MALSHRYETYLDHLGVTVPVSFLRLAEPGSHAVALRHDVDHSIDMALEMACFEYRRNTRSTYYILPDAPYWNDANIIEKCLQLQDFGHEVGLHCNALAQWYTGATSDPAAYLKRMLDWLRGNGIRIKGMSAHGDKFCYDGQFINYWQFRELRPASPQESENGLTPEGVPGPDGQGGLQYPLDHVLTRPDGAGFALWSTSMAELGLEYDAMHVPFDHYYTDSGGEWTRSPDPCSVAMDTGRHQVLCHPEHWKGSQKIFFFLSTARSGSKWLSTVLDAASSVTSRHECMLNHRLVQGELVEDKRTADGFLELQAAPHSAKKLLLDVRPWVERLNRDYAEVNVYLEEFLPELTACYPESTLIHLHRRPADVVSSLLNRRWYDTPEDDRHPVMDVEHWEEMGPFEKACWYVRLVNERLMQACALSLRFDRMIRGPKELEIVLSQLGIGFYPRLAKPYFSKTINAGEKGIFPAYRRWSRKQKARYHAICDPLKKELGYHISGRLLIWLSQMALLFQKPPKSQRSTAQPNPPEPLPVDIAASSASPGCTVRHASGVLEIVPHGGRHAHVLLGGGAWHRTTNNAGWPSELAHYYRGELCATIGAGDTARVICLLYDAEGNQLEQRGLVRLRSDKSEYVFSFRPGSEAVRFNLAVYMSATALPASVVVRSFTLHKLPLTHEES